MLITTKSAEAAQRPFAGSGIGAHLCDGLVDAAPVGVSGPELGAPMGTGTAAALALPRVKWAVGISEGHAPADASDEGNQVSTQATTGIQAKTAQLKARQFKAQQFKAQQFKAQQFKYMTRVNPAFPGGVGPHPAREPEPV
jgi:hypothetical protein